MVASLLRVLTFQKVAYETGKALSVVERDRAALGLIINLFLIISPFSPAETDFAFLVSIFAK